MKVLRQEILGFGIFKIYIWSDKVELTVSAEDREGMKAFIYRWNIEKWKEFLEEIDNFDQGIRKQDLKNQAVVYNCGGGGERMWIILVFKKEEWPKFFELVKQAEIVQIEEGNNIGIF